MVIEFEGTFSLLVDPISSVCETVASAFKLSGPTEKWYANSPLFLETPKKTGRDACDTEIS
jgi:hypothetical protein